MEVIDVSVGTPQWYESKGFRFQTSIVHESASTLQLQQNGVTENRLAAHNAHVYVFFKEHYEYWARRLDVDPATWKWGTWGENITFSTALDERDFRLGDVWLVGRNVKLQVCGARVPCFKLSWRLQQPDKWLKELADSGRAGVYMKVIEGGIVRPGDKAELIQPGAPGAHDVAAITQLAFCRGLKSRDVMDILAKDPLLFGMNRLLFARKISALQDDDYLGKGAWKSWRDLRVERVEQPAPEIKSFYFKPLQKDSLPLANYLPGQFINVKLPSGLTRSWTISDWPSHHEPAHYRVSIKRQNQGSAWMYDHCTVGNILSVRSPAGRFHLDWTPQWVGRQVYLSAGIGVTPMISMMKAHLQHYAVSKAPAVWIHVASDKDNIPHLDEILKASGHKLIKKYIFLTCELDETTFEETLQNHEDNISFFRGRPSDEDTRQILTDPYHINPLDVTPIEIEGCKSTCYICGPVAFEITVKQHLKNIGVPEAMIRSELFAGKLESEATDMKKATIRFAKSKKTVSWSEDQPMSILEVAEAVGLSPDHGCRVGSCGACKTTLCKGSVSGSLEPDGGVLICTAKPASVEVELDL
ncbi:hypothetical protein M409DRAFT_28781 [Zasmidium cellare ATCC 36951]|uniref:MOSC domain-containing protein n=1 Tax=Zasmidium cellare ATCC 36951 TaxID=1080233 RepID=A0A6A6C4W0_ZASCE|nr:uncharacterized protein M409DRAFT_28781 [Zasmidium cellare ATCC 36951]KAF2160902.1 hypothetical protein M409DRAFT_28781 [Zasmidium cellare ATCC 36951]